MTRATAAAICAAVLLTATACTSDADHKNPAPATPSVKASAKPAADNIQYLDGVRITDVPELGGEKRVIASVADARDNRAVPLEGGLRKGTVGIAAYCRGKGTVTVELPQVGLTFPLECAAGKVAGIYNRMQVSTAHADACLQVTATSGVHWSLSAGQ